MKAITHRSIATFTTLSLLAVAVVAAHGQATTRYMGSVTAISGDKITVKTAQGDEHQVQVPSTAEVKRIEPGKRISMTQSRCHSARFRMATAFWSGLTLK